MKYTKTFMVVCMLIACLFQNFFATKNKQPHSDTTPPTQKINTSYHYLNVCKLNRLCDETIAESSIYDPETLILITSDLCNQTFTKIKEILLNKEVPEDSHYILDVLNYTEAINKINSIIFDKILKSEGDENVLPPLGTGPTNATKQALNKAFFTVSSALRKYENIFSLQLSYELKNYKTIRMIYDKMCRTWDGLWIISESPDFKD